MSDERSSLISVSYIFKSHASSLISRYLIDTGRHLLYKQAFLLSFADKAGEEGEAVIVGPWGARRGLWRNIRRGWRRPRKQRQHSRVIIGGTLSSVTEVKLIISCAWLLPSIQR